MAETYSDCCAEKQQVIEELYAANEKLREMERANGMGEIERIESKADDRAAHVLKRQAKPPLHDRRPTGRRCRTCRQGIVATEFICDCKILFFATKLNNDRRNHLEREIRVQPYYQL